MVEYTIMNRKCSFFLIIYLILNEKNLPGDCGYPDAGISQVGHFIIYYPEEKELTRNEYFRLLKAAGKQPRLKMILETICGTGIRVSELQYFTLENARRGEVTVSCNNKTRTILLPRKLRLKLLDYSRRQGIKEGHIFRTRTGAPVNRTNIWASMKKLCREAHVYPGKVFPHNLRKLFARTFYRMQKDIAGLADVLGHSNNDITL